MLAEIGGLLAGHQRKDSGRSLYTRDFGLGADGARSKGDELGPILRTL